MIPMLLTLIAFLVLKLILFIGYVPTESMEPTLKAGSYIVGLRNPTDLNTGDIIVFWHDSQLLVKRIAAGPGDQVDMRELVYIKNIAIPVWEEPVITVPEGCYFVLGDNADNSIDSRYWENPFVSHDQIVARLFVK